MNLQNNDSFHNNLSNSNFLFETIETPHNDNIKDDVLSPEAIAFNNFLHYIQENHPRINHKDNQAIRAGIKLRIPPLKGIEEFKRLYYKFFSTYLNKKKKISFNKKCEKWKLSQIILFVWAVSEYSFIENISIDSYTDNEWKFIASLFPYISHEQCKLKWYSIQKSCFQKAEWSKEEDKILLNLINKHRKIFKNHLSCKWHKIASELNTAKITNTIRLGKHCRERWLNHLDPSIKRYEWTIEEDLLLLENISKLGKKWSKISKEMIGRNENTVKNRFTSIIRSLKRVNKSLEINDINIIIDEFRKKIEENGYPMTKKKRELQAETHVNLIVVPEIQQYNDIKEEDHEEEEKDICGTLSPEKIYSEFKNSDYFFNNIPEEKPEIISNLQVSSPVSPDKADSKKLIYDISNYVLPNIYVKQYENEDSLVSSPAQKSPSNRKINYLKLLVPDNYSMDLDDISQKLSSMSISDQLMLETNRILTELSSHISEKGFFQNSVINSNSIVNTASMLNNNSALLAHSFFNSNSNVNTNSVVNSNSADNVCTGGQREEKKFHILIPRIENSIFDINQLGFYQPQSPSKMAKCKTFNQEANRYLQKVNLSDNIPFLGLPKKKKSMTGTFPFRK